MSAAGNHALWLRKCYLSVAPKITRFALVHQVIGSTPSTLETHTIRGGDLEGETAEILESFGDAATSHVSACTKAQTYGIVAYAEAEIVRQLTFRLRPPADAVDSGESEPATAQGVLGMTMRHLEGQAKLYMMGAEQAFKGIAAENESLRRRLAEKEERDIEVMKVLEQLHSAKGVRELEAEKTKRGEARKDRLLDKVETHLLPPLFEQASGAAPFYRLIDSLDETQFHALLGALKPEQQEIVLELMKRKSALEKALPAHGGSNGQPS